MTDGPVDWLLKPMVKFYKRSVLKDPFSVSVKQWKRDRGDDRLRYDYDLNADSVVLDVGGYVGDFAEAIFDRFGCRVLVFEPMPRFFEACQDRFAGNDNISVFKYGLGSKDETLQLSDSSDASSFFRDTKDGATISAAIRDIDAVWDELELGDVDLVKMNIEGGEYPLLRRMIEQNRSVHVKNFQVQFHDFINDATAQRNMLRQLLSETHDEQWCYEFVWENWQRKSNAA